MRSRTCGPLPRLRLPPIKSDGRIGLQLAFGLHAHAAVLRFVFDTVIVTFMVFESAARSVNCRVDLRL